MQAAAKSRGPKTPFHERIRWTQEERSLLIDAWIDAIRADPTRQLTPRDALHAAMKAKLPPERRRDIRSIPKRDYRWLTEGVQSRLAAELGPDQVEPEPVEPNPWADRDPEISPSGRIRWNVVEKEAMIAAGVKILRADRTGRMTYKQAMARAQLIALPPERRRNLKGIPLPYQQWFLQGVEAGLKNPPEPGPEPARPPGPPVMVPGTGFTMPSVLVDEPAAEPEPRPEPSSRPGPGRTGPTLPLIREPGPAPSPLRLDAEAAPGPEPVPGALAVGELDATGLIILGLSRLVAERNRIAQREAAVVAAVQELATQFETFKARILDRFTPIEQAAETTSQLLRTVLGSLDPALLREFEQAQPGPGIAPADPVEPGPRHAAGIGGIAAQAPAAVEPGPTAPKRPLPRICVVGLRPAAESQVRAEIRGQVAMSAILDDGRAIRHDYRQYDAVVITRHASHTTYNKILGQVPKDHVIRVRQTGIQSVTAAIRELDAQHALAWSSAIAEPGPAPIPPQ